MGHLIQRLNFLENRVSDLSKENVMLERENKALREQLSKYESPKNSRNSSIPPSRDQNRPKRNQSLRKPSGKKPGGQPGHKGSTLMMVDDPDEIVRIAPNYCTCCGDSLDGVEPVKLAARQIIDIPEPKVVCTQYQTYSKTCRCGHTTEGAFPEGVNAPVGYGPSTEALVGYFHARQYVPFERMKELFHDAYGLRISEGGLHCLLGRLTGKTTAAYRHIKARIERSAVVGGDETGANINGETKWFWTWQSPDCTYIAYSDTRGKATVERELPQGLPESTLVRDGWRPQAGTKAKHHQICLAHLRRDLNYLVERYPKASWAKRVKGLLADSLKLHREATWESGRHRAGRDGIAKRLCDFLEHPPDKAHKELYTFYKRMKREAQNLFTFLFVRDVPPDNNASERAIRNVKVKQKISGQFKVDRAAQAFAQIRSVIDTAKKNDRNILAALKLIASSGVRLEHTD